VTSRGARQAPLLVCIVSRDGRRDAERHDGCLGLSVSVSPAQGEATRARELNRLPRKRPPPSSCPLSPYTPCPFQLGSNVRDSAVPSNLRRGSDYRVA
jgi:hypothetical protein